MKKILGVAGLAAACGLCCAIPVALPLLGGVAFSGLGAAIGWDVAGLLALASVMSLLALARWRRARAGVCAPAQGSTACGCAGACATGKPGLDRSA